MNNHQAGMRAALARCGWLTATALGLWLLLLVPARSLAGGLGIEGLSYAALLCVVPGCLVFIIAALYSSAGTPIALIMLAGTGVRMFSVLVGILFVQAVRPDLGFREFVAWVLVFYLAMLVAETLMAVRTASEQAASHSANGT